MNEEKWRENLETSKGRNSTFLRIKYKIITKATTKADMLKVTFYIYRYVKLHPNFTFLKLGMSYVA